MIHDVLNWLGWYVDNAFPQPAVTFWSTPLGLSCTFIMMVYHACRVLHPHYKADSVDTAFNIAFSLLFLLAFCVGITGSIPHYLVKTWLLLATIRCLVRGLVDWITGNKKAR